MKKYLIIVDLDGTILDDEKNISINTVNILKKCKILGHKIVISTARSYLRTKKYIEMINSDFISCFSGNYIYDSEGKVLYSNAIPKDISMNFIKEMLLNNNEIINEGLYSSFCSTIENDTFLNSIHVSKQHLIELESYKIIVKCSQSVYFGIKCIAENSHLTTTFAQENGFICILPENTDKWHGITKILKTLNKSYDTLVFGDDVADLNSLINASIGVRMENSATQVVENVNFVTDTNNNDGVAKFLLNYFNLSRNEIKLENVKVLDCSLRDGGHLNKSNFGYNTIKEFIQNLVYANVDIIEIGFLQDCEFSKDVAMYPDVLSAETMIENIECGNVSIALLTQVDKFDINKLEEKSGKINTIRVSFHKEYIDKAMLFVKVVKEKGYICSINPINFSQYTNSEVVELLKQINIVSPNIFTVVDTFGVMLQNDFINKLDLVNSLINKNINVGIHLHDNLSMAFSSAQQIIDKNSSKFNLVIDSSVCGIGRAPGNLQTELILYYINKLSNSNRYKMEYIYYIIENIISCLKKTLDWNKYFAYSISAFENTHRTYAEYLLDNNYSIEESEKIIKKIPFNEKTKFNSTLIKLILEEEL